MSDARAKIDAINAMGAANFMDDPGIRQQFVATNMKIRGVTQQEAEMFCDRQGIYYKRVISNSWNPDKRDNYLGNCTTFSHYATFMDMAVYGDVLSFNPEDKLVYVELGNYKAGRLDGQDLWEKRAKLVISPYGELNLRIDAGQIAYADPVVVVREGDLFELGTDDFSNVVVKWKSKVVGDGRRIVAGFVKITRPNNSFVIGYMLQDDINRLEGYSKRKNRGKSNALYGTGEGGAGIDAGFFKAKVLKHSFKTFSKTRLRGTNSIIDDMEDDESMDTGVPEGFAGNAGPAPRQPQSFNLQTNGWQQEEPAGPSQQQPQGGQSDDWSEPGASVAKPGTSRVDVKNEFDESTF